MQKLLQVLALVAVVFAALNVAEVLTVVGPTGAAVLGAAAVVTGALASALQAPAPTLPGWVGGLAALAGVFGALNTAALLTLVGPEIGAGITMAATVTAALSRGLRDADGDGQLDGWPRTGGS